MPLAYTSDNPIQPWLLQAAVRVAAYLQAMGGEPVLEHYPFLTLYLDEARRSCPPASDLFELDRGWSGLIDPEAPADTPLARLRQAGLKPEHLRALLLIGLVEVDARFGTVYSMLHPFPDELRLTVGLLADLLTFNAVDDLVPVWHVVQELERRGLILIHQLDRPRAAQPLSLPAPVWAALCGEGFSRPWPELRLYPQTAFETLAELGGLLPPAWLARLGRVPQLVERGLAQGLVLRGMRGSGRRRALGALARTLGRDLLQLQQPAVQQLPGLCRLAGALATLHRAVPLIELELAPGEAIALPPLAGYNGLFGVMLGREGSLTGPQAEGCLLLEVPAADHEARRRQWSQVLDGRVNGTQAVIEDASRNYHLTLGAVERAGKLAQAYAALNDHAHIELADVQEACRALNRQSLENLASRIQTDGAWADLIVSETTRADLANLVRRCRQRETVLAHLGRGFTGIKRGVRALFGGPSGTGKTLAARLIAAELRLDLYRVDLSAVVSKYIGETERNLSRLFARAEEQDIVLLLDEGDSLLTARTDVRSANDRYANMETNYLLQRLEQYEGIILITTNAASRIDGAFQRRIDVFIEFSPPDAGQRQRLWQLHLPGQHAISPGFLRTVSLRCPLTGGQIRNAALPATVLAVDAGAPVCDALLAEGINREYTKQGAASPLN
ncbi:MAG TPA: ATP-binding protein [Anaerolineae bacterium]|nr:ATP-binding protein [Anaerolineae bacterium]